jgi:AcrR family transcriptional regulator
VEKKISRARQPELTRAALIQAARQLFAEKGYHATGTHEIAERAQVTRGALVHHFAKKEELFLAVFEAVEDDLMAGSELLIQSTKGKELWNAFRSSLGSFLDAATKPEVQRILLIDGPSVLGWEKWRELETHYGMALIRAALVGAMEDGIMRKAPVEPLAHMIMAVIHEAALFIAHSKRSKQVRADVQKAVDVMLSSMS